MSDLAERLGRLIMSGEPESDYEALWPEVRAVVRSMEAARECPDCGAVRPRPHHETCSLTALARRMDEEEL